MNKPVILVVEDDAPVRNLMSTTLKTHDYKYLTAPTGRDAVMMASSHNPDVVFLDLGLPDMDGVEVIRQIRSWSNMPIIVISARSEDDDKITALDAGADDYLAKPFASSELIARVKALGRRSEIYSDSVKSAGNLILDSNKYEMRAGSKSVSLTNKEYQLMELFITHPGFVFSTEHLMEKIWGLDSESYIDVVWTHIGFVRKKLKQLDADVEIKTIRGAGYSLEVIK